MTQLINCLFINICLLAKLFFIQSSCKIIKTQSKNKFYEQQLIGNIIILKDGVILLILFYGMNFIIFHLNFHKYPTIKHDLLSFK